MAGNPGTRYECSYLKTALDEGVDPTMAKTIYLDGDTLDLRAARAIGEGAPVALSPDARPRVDASYALVQRLVKSKTPIYGLNTGYGYLANTRIKPDKQRKLQKNIVLSHASGYGDPLSIAETRLTMALRLNVLAKGHSGVRWELCKLIAKHIEAGIYPLIPEYGSVGASGDLAPLAHLALPLIGKGMVRYKGRIMATREALRATGIRAITLHEKEGLSLVNGTQALLAVGALALTEAVTLAIVADKIAALTYEGLAARCAPLDPLIHKARGSAMQEASAALIREQLTGSYLYEKKTKHPRVQDPYSVRCAPQVHGASRSALAYASSVLENELNAATDNPLVFADEERIVAGGNFHGQPVAVALDAAAMAVAELGSISERRLEVLLNTHFSGLPPFLTATPGACSGYMATQYLAGSLVNENKLLANPTCTDSIPGNMGIEDHVSMGATSARKLRQIVHNLKAILAIELVAAAQAVDLRKVKQLGEGTTRTHRRLRRAVKMLEGDRVVSDDITKAVAILHKL